MSATPFSLSGKVCVVTGGLGQLGRTLTSQMLELGARVAIVDIQAPKTTDERILYFEADITDKSQLTNVLQKIQKQWGTPHVLINNAALDSPPSAPAEENGPFESYPDSSLDRVIDVNLKGTLYCCQVFGGAMAKEGRGSIVNVSSIYGMLSPQQDIYEYRRKDGKTFFKPVGYAVTKSAVLNLTRYLATYWAKQGVRVNTVCPAGIFNNQDEEFLKEYLKRVPIGRMADTKEIASPICFLASDASSYVTGSQLVVDGGWSAW